MSVATTEKKATVVLDRLVTYLHDHHPEVLRTFMEEGLANRRRRLDAVPLDEQMEGLGDLRFLIDLWNETCPLAQLS